MPNKPLNPPRFGKVLSPHDLGELIRAFRKGKGYSLERVSGLTGLSIRFLSELERGKATAELGKTLEILFKLGLEVSVHPRGFDEQRLQAIRQKEYEEAENKNSLEGKADREDKEDHEH